ncbi:MAG TPA: hypothetical protein VL593_17305 [Ramlibacter sp.]|nr:hypothetical protein [Ramlibacter sp.]
MRVELIDRETHIEGRVEGLVSMHAWETMLTNLNRELGTRTGDRLLLDLFGLLGYLGEADRRAVGALMATQFAGLKKVALVIDAYKISGVVEREARRLGLDLRLFPDRDVALAWLLH